MPCPVPVLSLTPILMPTRTLVMPPHGIRVHHSPTGRIIRPSHAKLRLARDGYWVALFRHHHPLGWIARLCNRDPDLIRRRMALWRRGEHLFPLPDDPPGELILPELRIAVEVDAAGHVLLPDDPELCLIRDWIWVTWTRAAVPLWAHVAMFHRVAGHIRRSMRRWDAIEDLPLEDIHARRLFLPRRAP